MNKIASALRLKCREIAFQCVDPSEHRELASESIPDVEENGSANLPASKHVSINPLPKASNVPRFLPQGRSIQLSHNNPLLCSRRKPEMIKLMKINGSLGLCLPEEDTHDMDSNGLLRRPTSPHAQETPHQSVRTAVSNFVSSPQLHLNPCCSSPTTPQVLASVCRQVKPAIKSATLSKDRSVPPARLVRDKNTRLHRQQQSDLSKPKVKQDPLRTSQMLQEIPANKKKVSFSQMKIVYVYRST